jgi:RimJ/RimL family protein N-acetyltransferase
MICKDKIGCDFEVKAYTPGDFSHLLAMYDLFKPKVKFQGMPPMGKEACTKWIRGLVDEGENFLAWRGDKVVGHVVVLPDFDKGDAEYLIFVDQFNRGVGVGTELTRTAIKKAEELSLKTVWLTVDAYNFRATKLYKKCGFSFCKAYESPSERMMEYVCECTNGG